MTLLNMELHTSPGYYLASSFPVRLHSAWGARIEVVVLSLNMYVLVWDFRILYLLDNTYFFILSMFLPLGFYKKDDSKVKKCIWTTPNQASRCRTWMQNMDAAWTQGESRDKSNTWVKAAKKRYSQGFSSLCSYQLQLKSALDFLVGKRKIICESLLLHGISGAIQ